MNKALEQIVRNRAHGICEYCHLPEMYSKLRFSVDHIVSKQQRGGTVAENLALACPSCNQHKGPNIAGVDPESGAVVALFHPRRDRWGEHFRWRRERIIAWTAVGRVTVHTLAMNNRTQLALRRSLLPEGVFPL